MQVVQLQMFKQLAFKTVVEHYVFGIQHVKKKHVLMHQAQIIHMIYVQLIYQLVQLMLQIMDVLIEVVQMHQQLLLQMQIVIHIFQIKIV